MVDLISVVVPVYQVCDYIDRCVISIRMQTYDNLQIILIDDGSTDGSGEKCDYYASIDSRIEVCHKSNEGLVRARKSGINLARGKYLCFVDGDDYIDEEMMMSLYHEIQYNSADMIHSSFFFEDNISRNGNKLKRSVINIENYDERRRVWIDCLLNNRYECVITPRIWSKMFKRDFIERMYELVPDYQSYGEDIICLYLCLMNCKKLIISERKFYHYLNPLNSNAL